MNGEVYAGNAGPDAAGNRGWLLGHFMPPGVRQSDDLEVKWGVHPAGESRAGWTAGDTRSTMVLLIEGRFHLELTTGGHLLAERGDYVVWGPGIDHSWRAETDSVLLTVRWPSIPL
ncbi:hypothetical protein F4553_006244 [Allocatelliglobosispora scoriae]|uniref:Signal peptidase I n=1 Tax=Allocatelliglobosispora scoriae TaxID=643052 RepID=A0A841C1G1_9ACTN|nr:signal peptidase I [Allocatelliglobosispora scoriae]MBB5872810.1 hypothetical protein [Allocatelliglobosispora scoriae]